MAEIKLTRGDSIHFFGSLQLEVQDGTVSVLGAHLNSQNFGSTSGFTLNRCIWSPSFCPSVGIQCISPTATILIKKNTFFTSRPDLVSLFFSNLPSDSFDPAFPVIPGFWPLLKQHPLFNNAIFDFSCFHENNVDSHLVNSFSSKFTFFAGGKGSGKSTTCIYKINSLLNTHPKVQILDVDVGQPLFTVPGVLSLFEIDSFVLCPFPGVLPFKAWSYAWCIGNNTPKDSVDDYIHGSYSLVQQLQWNTPIVVNTMGWIIATGYFLLKKIHSFLIHSYLEYSKKVKWDYTVDPFRTIFLDPYQKFVSTPSFSAVTKAPETATNLPVKKKSTSPIQNSLQQEEEVDVHLPTDLPAADNTSDTETKFSGLPLISSEDTPPEKVTPPNFSRDPNQQQVKPWMGKSHYSRMKCRPLEKVPFNTYLSAKHLRSMRWLNYFGLPVFRLLSSSIPQESSSSSFSESMKVLTHLHGFPISLADDRGFCSSIALLRFVDISPSSKEFSPQSTSPGSRTGFNSTLYLFIPTSQPVSLFPDSIEITSFPPLSSNCTTLLDTTFPSIPWLWKSLLRMIEPSVYTQAKQGLQILYRKNPSSLHKNQLVKHNESLNSDSPGSNSGIQNTNPSEPVRSKRNRFHSSSSSSDNLLILGKALKMINSWISAINDTQRNYLHKSLSREQGGSVKRFRVAN